MIVSVSGSEPITAEFVKSYLHWDDFTSDMDAILLEYISGARELFEKFLNISLIEKTYRQWFVYNYHHYHHHDYYLTGDKFELFYPPHYDYNSSNSVLLYEISDDSTETQLTENTDFYIHKYFTWELEILSGEERFKVDYKAGYGSETETLPSILKMAIAEQIGNWYEGETEVGELSRAVVNKIGAYSFNTIV